MNIDERIKGCLYGFACGDALGAPFEFKTDLYISEHYGYINEMHSGGMWNVEKGEGTDDTALMLILANAILNDKTDPYTRFGNRLIDWYNSNPKDIGLTTLRTLNNYLKCNNWVKASEQTYMQTFGNAHTPGSLSRVLPVALFYTDINCIENVAYKQSKMTHFSELACQCCIFYSKLIYSILQGATKFQLQMICTDFYQDISILKKQHILYPNGNVLDILNCSIKCFINSTSYKEAVCKAVNLGGDADTIGALTGGLAGAFFGYSTIPQSWLNDLKSKDSIQQLIQNYKSNIC